MTDYQTKTTKEYKKKYEDIKPFLNEKGRRIWAATEAKSYGWGGVTILSKAVGLSEKTIRKGIKELESPDKIDQNRIRKEGAGRKKLEKKDPTIKEDIKEILEASTRGDPMSPLLWTSKSAPKIATEINKNGHRIGETKLREILEELGYSLQGNKKTEEGSDHKDRDAQFNHINQAVKANWEKGNPTISVDTKKKENIGNYANKGKDYRKKGDPVKVKDHDFPDKKLGKVAPYGIYDIKNNKGWVNVGISNDTAEFAVNSIRKWWKDMGSEKFKDKKRLMITADSGGSNGYRVRLWKIELQKFANDIGLEIEVAHFPPGTSKWNKIEHRLFSFITENWRGRPLISRKAVVQLIRHTKTAKGLKVKAFLDRRIYEKGIKVSDEELSNVNIERLNFHGEWNYIIRPN